jgi:hypothetical protein
MEISLTVNERTTFEYAALAGSPPGLDIRSWTIVLEVYHAVNE